MDARYEAIRPREGPAIKADTWGGIGLTKGPPLGLSNQPEWQATVSWLKDKACPAIKLTKLLTLGLIKGLAVEPVIRGDSERTDQNKRV